MPSPPYLSEHYTLGNTLARQMTTWDTIPPDTTIEIRSLRFPRQLSEGILCFLESYIGHSNEWVLWDSGYY